MTAELDLVMAAKLESSLTNISTKLGQIEEQLKDIVRLQERVSNHDKTLARYGDKLDRHELRMHEAEIWQANHGDKTQIEKLVLDIRVDVKETNKRIDNLERSNATNLGQKDVAKEILKWVAGILSAIIIFLVVGK